MGLKFLPNGTGTICTKHLVISRVVLATWKTIHQQVFFWLMENLQDTFQHKSPNNTLGGFLHHHTLGLLPPLTAVGANPSQRSGSCSSREHITAPTTRLRSFWVPANTCLLLPCQGSRQQTLFLDGLLVSIKDEHGPELQTHLIFQVVICTKQQGLEFIWCSEKGNVINVHKYIYTHIHSSICSG